MGDLGALKLALAFLVGELVIPMLVMGVGAFLVICAIAAPFALAILLCQAVPVVFKSVARRFKGRPQ